jgi:hypothetical protein
MIVFVLTLANLHFMLNCNVSRLGEVAEHKTSLELQTLKIR